MDKNNVKYIILMIMILFTNVGLEYMIKGWIGLSDYRLSLLLTDILVSISTILACICLFESMLYGKLFFNKNKDIFLIILIVSIISLIIDLIYVFKSNPILINFAEKYIYGIIFTILLSIGIMGTSTYTILKVMNDPHLI